MALSFEESKKLYAKQSAVPATMSLRATNPGVMTLDEAGGEAIAAYSVMSINTKYPYFENHIDENISTIDDKKEITVHSAQVNISQEANSQFIPFKMKRYYDGIDLNEMTLSIHYTRSDGTHGGSTPVNVEYDEADIKFVWLVDEQATCVAGALKFEIHADGTIIDNKGREYGYRWKSKPTDKFNIAASLCATEDCEPVVVTDDWVVDIVENVANAVGEKIANAELSGYVTDAELEAKGYLTEHQSLEGYATETYVAQQIANADIEGKLTAYAKTADVNALVGDLGANEDGSIVTVKQYVDNHDVSDQLKDYALKSELPVIPENVSAFNNDAGYLTEHQSLDDYALKADIPTNVSAFTNDAGYLTEHQSLDGYATETFVANKIGSLGNDAEGNPIETVVDYVGKNYYAKSETYNKNEIDDAIDNVQVDLTGYATTEALNAVQQNTITNATNIATVQNDITTIQSSLNSLEGDNQNLLIQYDEVGSILHLYEKDENGDITITDGDEQIRVKEISSTIITGAGGGPSSLVSTVKLKVSVDGAESTTVLAGTPTFLNYNLSTRKAKEIQDDEGNDVTVYEESVIAGDITFTLYRDSVYLTHFTVTKTSSEVQKGSVDISEYILLNDHIYTITASYVEQLGADGESITVRSSEDWAINAVKLGINLEEKYLPGKTWETTPIYGNATFSYTPIGALEKTVYFQIDDEEPETLTTSLNGTTLPYTIPQQTHGIHTFQVWCEANIGGTVIPTEPYKYVLMFVESGNESPIIRIKVPTTYSRVDGHWVEHTTLEQYSATDIYYNVFDPLNGIIDSVTIYDEDGTILSSPKNITSAEQRYEFRPTVAKNKTITIQYKETTESVAIEVTKFRYDDEIKAITDGLMVDFVPTGRNNEDADYNVFKNNAYTVEKDQDTGEEIQKEIPITWEFSPNFDWINGGWQRDENGDTYFCVKAGTSVDINYNLFGTDGVIAKTDANGEYTIAGTGKEFKLIFKTTNVAKASATWLQCVDVADKKSLGIIMEAQNAYVDSSVGTLEIPYVDNDIIEFDMNIVPVTQFNADKTPNFNVKAIPMVMTYEDGTPVQPKVISSAKTSFKQDTPQPITIGSDYCDVHIYRMKIYERYLEDKEILNNFIADARSGVEMAQRYIRNDIYPIDDKQKITPESVAAACPDLKVYVLSAPYFTNDKEDKVPATTIRQIHNTGTREKPEYAPSENWTATGATHNGQGTSSNEYGYSGRNLEFNLEKATITLNDNTTVVQEIQLSPTSYPTNYLNFKINIASSENANNALLQKRYDRYLPYTSVASLIDDRKKNSMEFFNCVVFIQETDTTLTKHREFNDTDVHFYGIGNIGDSKKTDYTRVNDVNDTKEFCVEIKDWNRYLSSFPADTMVSTLYTDYDENGEEIQVLRFEDLLVDTNLGEEGIIFERDGNGNYYHSTDATVDKTKTYYIDVLENDKFDDAFTYEFRYVQKKWKEKDGADYKERNEEFQRPLRQKWTEFYRFITRDLTTNGVEDEAKVAAWKSEFSEWFILDSALYYYLYTLRYTMVDNRAKNTFWHWGKHYLTFEEAIDKGIAVYDENGNLSTDPLNPPSRFYDVHGQEIKNINSTAAAINDGYRMEFWAYDNDTALGIDNAGKLEIPIGVEEDDTDAAGVPYFRAHDSLVFVRIAKYFVDELEDMWYTTETPEITFPEGVGQKVFDSTSFINEFDKWQDQFPEELWRLDYERKYKRTYVGGTGMNWDNALPQSNKSDIVSTRFLTEMMNGRKKYQRRCFERNQEIYMSSKFKGEVNLSDTITLRGIGRPTGKVVSPNFTLRMIPFSKMYVNVYDSTDHCYYHKKWEAGVQYEPIPYPNTNLDFLYVRGASQVQSLGDLSPMYLQTAELTSGAKLKTITLGNPAGLNTDDKTDDYSNDSLKTLQIGAGNKLLEELNIQNLSIVESTVLPVSNIPSLKRVYAQGSNISEVTFANNGLLEEAYLPETITRLELRHLNYLTTMKLEAYDNLLHLVVMDCSETMHNRVLDIINQAPDLKSLRVNNINWTLGDIAVLERLYSLIKTPSSPEVMLAGTVSLPLIGSHDLAKYNKMWSDLTIEAATVKPQFKVTFLNVNGDELDVQYIEQFKDAVDPTTRTGFPTPTQDSTAQYDYTFAGWDTALTNITADRVIKATYTLEVRKYTVKYVSKGAPIKTETDMPYGSNSVYDGDIPTYTAEEPYAFYLFDGWDKDGYVDGNKTINAVYDSCIYTDGYFVNRDLSKMRPVEIYMMIRLNALGSISLADYIEAKDSVKIQLGNDFSYANIAEQVLIDSPVEFTGSNYVDTGIQLLSKDRDFVLAIDYSMDSTNTNGNVFVQCYSDNGMSGFRLWHNGGVKLGWGTSSTSPSIADEREVVVIRHIKGENGVHVYASNTASTAPSYIELDGNHSVIHNNSLVFGCSRSDDGTYEKYAKGAVYWSKVWYADLGDEVCRQIVAWPHETMNFEMCGFKRYFLSDNANKRATMSLLASNVLSRKMQLNSLESNAGGWASSELNARLNNRIYNAIPVQWRQLLKRVSVKSSIGGQSYAISSSDCYIAVPSAYELDASKSTEPYNNEGSPIEYFTTNETRICYDNNGKAVAYWTRSPHISYQQYQHTVSTSGGLTNISSPTSYYHVRIMISM